MTSKERIKILIEKGSSLERVRTFWCELQAGSLFSSTKFSATNGERHTLEYYEELAQRRGFKTCILEDSFRYAKLLILEKEGQTFCIHFHEGRVNFSIVFDRSRLKLKFWMDNLIPVNDIDPEELLDFIEKILEKRAEWIKEADEMYMSHKKKEIKHDIIYNAVKGILRERLLDTGISFAVKQQREGVRMEFLLNDLCYGADLPYDRPMSEAESVISFALKIKELVEAQSFPVEFKMRNVYQQWETSESTGSNK